jgi:hypothetical protein
MHDKQNHSLRLEFTGNCMGRISHTAYACPQRFGPPVKVFALAQLNFMGVPPTFLWKLTAPPLLVLRPKAFMSGSIIPVLFATMFTNSMAAWSF